MSDKPKAIGSCYLNASKDTPYEAKEKLPSIVNWMKENKIQLSFSVHQGRLQETPANDRGYVPFIGFTNSYKKTPKDSDIVLYPKQSQGGGYNPKPQTPKEDLPF